MHREFARAFTLLDLKERLAGLGADPVGSTPHELAAFIMREFVTWAKVAKQAGIHLD